MNGNAPEQVLRGILFMGSFPPAAVFVERRIAGVEILGVEVILCDAEGFSEPLEMDDLALSEEADRVADIGIVGETKDIVVGRARLLLRSHILVQVGDDVALGLEISRSKWRSGGGDWVDAGGVIDEIGVESARLDLVDRKPFGQLVKDCGYHFNVCKFIGTLMMSAKTDNQ